MVGAYWNYSDESLLKSVLINYPGSLLYQEARRRGLVP